MRIFLTMITALCWAPKVILGVPKEPRNVRMDSYNMDMVLRWDPPENTSKVLYTTEFNTTVSSYRPGCVNTSAQYCDFTALGMLFTVYGTYVGRVRAQLGNESSVWVESRPLTLDINTTIGPPNVTLVSNGVHMSINIRDPVFRINNLRQIYNHASYNITYWREDEEDMAQSLSVQQNPVILSDLEPWSRYCVKVQIETHLLKTSVESRVACENTTDEERAPWLEAVVIFLVMAMVVTVVVVVVVYRKKLSNFLSPNNSLPPYFNKNMGKTPSSLIHVAMGNYGPPVETCDQVNVITTENDTDEGRPLVAEEGHCSA